MNSARRRQLSRFDFARDQWRCLWCGRDVSDGGATIDHVKPVSAGGRDVRTNLITSCIDCNQRRKDWSVAEFAALFHDPVAVRRRIRQARHTFKW